MKLISLTAVALTLLLAATAVTATTKHFCYSMPFLLGGSLTSCRTPTDTTACSAGYASSEAWVRYFRSLGHPTVHLFPLDFLSPFTQMHQLKWDVNALFYQHYSARSWVSLPNILVGNNPQMNLMLSPSFPWVMTNIIVKPETNLDGYRVPSFVDPETQVGFLVLGAASNNDLNDDVVLSALRGIQQLWRSSPQPKHVVIFDISAGTASNATTILSLLQQQAYLKIDAYYALDSAQSADSVTTVYNGTFVATVKAEGYSRSGLPSTNLVCLDMQVDSNNNVYNISLGAYPISPLPANLRDANYYADVAFSQTLAEQAIANDPVIGYSTVMPLTADAANNLGYCYAGDCALGNLFTDSFAWRMNADMAFINSGGLRGSGWPAGVVKFSRTYESDPYPDTMNVAQLTGLSVWQILNHSVGVPFTNSYTLTNSYLLQISGLRVTYSNNIGPFKLVSVEVRNRQTGLYEPLDRLKLYTVVMSVYEVCCLEPYASIMTKARYRGETSATDHPDLPLQNVIAQYLTATTTSANPYQVEQYKRYIAAPSTVTAADAMNWGQTQASCGVNTYWDAGIATCVACPAGLVQPTPGQTTCQPPSSSTNITSIVVPIVVVLVVIVVIAVVVAVKGASGGRSTANAPTGGRITIMFTDIQDSTRLWGALPLSMNHALVKHHEIVRTAIEKHKGYEVKTIGDSFMIAVSNEDAAVQIAMDIQRNLQAASWPPCIHQAYNAKSDEELEAIDDDPKAKPIHDDLFNGLRVRIGIHSGEPKAEIDPVTKGYDYYGPTVNVAARVETSTKGGQVCCTVAVLNNLNNRAGLDVRPIGQFELKGVMGKTEFVEILPEELARRRFGFTGADGVTDKQDTNTDHTSETGSTAMDAGPVEFSPETFGLFFLQGLMRALNSDDHKKVRSTLLSAWHVPDDPAKKDTDAAERRLCKRVLPNALRKLKKVSDQTVAAANTGDSNGGGDIIPGRVQSFNSKEP